MVEKKFRRKKIGRKKFDQKLKNIFRDQKNFGKKSMKKSMKMKILKFREKKSKNPKFQNFNFSLICFPKFFWSRKYFFRCLIEIFFDQFFFDENFFDHIFRLKKSPRFQKSHLENYSMRPGPPSSLCKFLRRFPPTIATNLCWLSIILWYCIDASPQVLVLK